MTSLVFWPFSTYLPTYLVLLYNVPYWGLSWTPLPTLLWDVINERSQCENYLKEPSQKTSTLKQLLNKMQSFTNETQVSSKFFVLFSKF